MSIPVQVTVGPLAASSATKIALAQALGAAGNLTLNGAAVSSGVATLDTGRQVGITSVGNDSGITWTITGTNDSGNPWQEAVTGATAGNTAVTTSSFKTVTRIAASGATAGNVTAGTTGVAMSRWVYVSWMEGPSNVSLAAIVTGTVNYSIQYAYQDPSQPAANLMGSQSLGNYPTVPTPFTHPVLVNQTASSDGTLNDPIICWRVIVNSGATGASSIMVIGIQSGVAESNWA